MVILVRHLKVLDHIDHNRGESGDLGKGLRCFVGRTKRALGFSLVRV